VDEPRNSLGSHRRSEEVPVVGVSGSVGGSLGRFQNLGKRLRVVEQLGTAKSEDQAPKQKVKELGRVARQSFIDINEQFILGVSAFADPKNSIIPRWSIGMHART